MKGFPKHINSKQDVMNLLPDYPEKVKEYLTKLLNERKYYNDDRVYVDNPNAALFRMGFTTEEAISFLDSYNEPPKPDPPMTEEEREVAELQAWREKATVSRRQAIEALNDVGLLSSVETYMETGGASFTAKNAWKNSYRFSRNSYLLDSIALELGMTPTQVDDLFMLAQSKGV